MFAIVIKRTQSYRQLQGRSLKCPPQENQKKTKPSKRLSQIKAHMRKTPPWHVSLYQHHRWAYYYGHRWPVCNCTYWLWATACPVWVGVWFLQLRPSVSPRQWPRQLLLCCSPPGLYLALDTATSSNATCMSMFCNVLAGKSISFMFISIKYKHFKLLPHNLNKPLFPCNSVQLVI